MTIEKNAKFRPRGTTVMLNHGGLPEVIPDYLQQLIQATGGIDGPIGRQFVAQPELENENTANIDPLMEDHHEVAPGLVYKYVAGNDPNGNEWKGRALWTITRNCAAYCRFCTRGREVGIPAKMAGNSESALAHTPHLTITQIDQSLEFIRHEKGLNEVILSGGDPLTVKPEVLKYVLESLGRMQKAGELEIVRIGTRLPVHNPVGVKDSHYESVGKIENPRLMVHINHPEELTAQTLDVLNRFRQQSGAIVMSQTVLLRGINDSVQTLYQLFNNMAKAGIVPYYVYQNDPVPWAQHHTVSMEEAIAIWNQLRPKLSGVAATARFVIDVPLGYGKVPIPEGGAWDIDYQSGYTDFKGNKHSI